ncbi:MAG: 2-oxo acid dehydrogenase subunit E2 [Rubrivivax sp.]|nr:2-oxo acid dehydrogenase subunit E2 [Rubrivivax sp.]
MGVRIIKVPDVGEGIAEVELVAWHVAPGDEVAEDQPVADVMTDKANVEIPTPVAGRVLALGGEVGRTLAVGSELLRIEQAEAGAAHAPGTAAAAAGAAAAAAADASGLAPAPVLAPAPAFAPAPGSAPAPVQTQPAAAAPIPASIPAPSTVAPASAADRPIASPAVRRRAWELGIDLSSVRPSGTAGRIVHADIEAAARARGTLPAAAAPPIAPPIAPPTASPIAPAARAAPATPAASAAPAEASAAAAAAYAQRDDETRVPVIGLRRRIALQMQEAKRRIPHFSYVEELDITEAEALRARLNARWAAARGRLTLLPLLMRAMVLALRAHPQINARFDDEAGVLTQYGAVHLGVATQTPHGLLVPVLRHAEALDPWAMAAEVARLAEAARAGRATRAELSGSTITISSLGALGGIASTPVINRPEVAIVGVNRIVEKPVVRAGAVVVRQTMNLSSSFDHRIVDGADAAQFVQELRMRLETPALLFVA